MDSDVVKEKLGIPKEHYVATITPIGFPARVPKAPRRRDSDDMVKYID